MRVPATAFALFAFASCFGQSSAADPSAVGTTAHQFSFVGEFSNMRSTEEHNYGAAVNLWRLGSSVFGLLDVADGLQGDTPVGRLEGVRFDPASGRISFKAKLTIGRHYCPQHRKGVPARDLFKFSGRLGKERLTGTLVHSDELHPESKPHVEMVALRKTAGASPIEVAGYPE